MLYALLAAISKPSVPIITPTTTIAVTPTATAFLTPIPTLIPTPIATHIPADITILPSWTEYLTLGVAIISIIATIILGIQAHKSSKTANELAKTANEQNETAIKLSNSANSLAQTAIEQSERTAQHEKDMRKLENTIMVSERILSIYDFFVTEAINKDFYLLKNKAHSINRLSSIDVYSQFLFSNATYVLIHDNILLILNYLSTGELPSKEELLSKHSKLQCTGDINDFLSDFPTEDEQRFELMKMLIMFTTGDILEKYNLKL